MATQAQLRRLAPPLKLSKHDMRNWAVLQCKDALVKRLPEGAAYAANDLDKKRAGWCTRGYWSAAK